MIQLTVQCLLGIGVWFGIWFCQANVSAQDAPVPSPAWSAKKNETVIQRTPIDAVVVFDNEGNRALYLPGNWPLTVFDDFHYFIQRNQQSPVPLFVIQNVSATGTTVGNYVEIDVRIELSTFSDQPVRIPLGFTEGIIPSDDQTNRPPFRYTGTGSADFTFDSNERQYVAVVIPQTDQIAEPEGSDKTEKSKLTQRHTISLWLWIPLVQNSSGENQLSLSFPPTIRSQFLLEVPMSNITASVSQGSILLDVLENAEQQSTLLKIQGLRTDTKISWEKKKTEVVDDHPVLLVERASIETRLDALSTVYDAVLPISCVTGSFDQVQIRLPQGCVLDREMTDKYAATGDYAVGNVDERSIVTIQFLRKITNSVSVRLIATQHFEIEGNKSDFQRDLTGFEVLGAERQTGFLTVSVFPSEMSLYWDPIRGIRRTEGISSNTDVPSLTPAATIVPSHASNTRFEFMSQPFQLSVQAISPKTRINSKPEYQFHIKKGQILMTARFSYTVSGFKTDSLSILLSDSQWHCKVGLSNFIDNAEVKLDDSGLLTIPLRSPMDGSFDIELQAYRSISTDEDQKLRIVLPIPNPQVTWSESALVTIVSDNNVEVLPVDELYLASSKQRTFGLTRQTRRTVPLRSDFAEFQQEPLFYRTGLTEAIFVADLIYRQQEIKTTIQTDVRLFEEYNHVMQTIVYEAAYVPVDRLYFLIPESLASNGDIQVSLDHQTLKLRDTFSDRLDNVPKNWIRKSVQLPEPTFRLQLTLQYSLPPFNVPDDTTTLHSLSFICPTEVPVSDHRIHFFTPSDYKIELQDESKLFWELSKEPRHSSSEAMKTFRSVLSPNNIALSISVSDKNISGTTIVECAWLQTWLTSTIRQDRATYLLKSTHNSIMLQLPPDSMRDHRIIVRVDRQQIQPHVSPTGVLTIPILPEYNNRLIEVSVEYRYTFNISGVEVPIILPTFGKETLVQYGYWQIILPQHKHIIGWTAGWTLEYDWNWNGLFFGRVPSIRKIDVGFQPDSTDNETAMSQSSHYLFSHLHPSGYTTLYVVNRSLIVFYSSGIALLIGLVLIYVRQSRYTGSLFGLGVALIAVLCYQPPLVLLLLQAAAFGVFLALGAGYVYRIFNRQKSWIPSAFPTIDEVSQPYLTPVPISQTIHEVVMDGESADNDAVSAAINNHNNTPPNGQP